MRVDEADHLDDALDAVEVADGGLRHAEEVDGADACRLLAFLDRVLAADLADELHALGGHRDLAGEEKQLAGDDEGHVVCGGLARNRQNDAKRLQSRFDFAGHCRFSSG